MRSLFTLRIVKEPDWTRHPAHTDSARHYQVGRYCAGELEAFRGYDLPLAKFYPFALEAAAALARGETRHPGMALEIVEFREQDHRSRHEDHVAKVMAFCAMNGGVG